jgi:hypothetical protein
MKNKKLMASLRSWLKEDKGNMIRMAVELNYTTSMAIYNWLRHDSIPVREWDRVSKIIGHKEQNE